MNNKTAIINNGIDDGSSTNITLSDSFLTVEFLFTIQF